jgi:hypothetical protein
LHGQLVAPPALLGVSLEIIAGSEACAPEGVALVHPSERPRLTTIPKMTVDKMAIAPRIPLCLNMGPILREIEYFFPSPPTVGDDGKTVHQALRYCSNADG